MDRSSPKVSVVMPFYNAERFLDQAVSSILNQTLQQFELIIINDGSTDNSDQILNKYLSDKRIVYINHKTNYGIAYNENLGLSLSRTNFIARLDGDDIAESTRLEKQYSFLETNPHISVVGTYARTINEQGDYLGTMEFQQRFKKISKTYFYHYPILHGSAMYRTKDIIDIGGFNEELSLVDDSDMLLRLLMSGKLADNIPEYLLLYRKHSQSTHHHFKAKRDLMYKSRMQAIKQYHPKGKLMMYLYTHITYFIETIFNAQQKEALVNIIMKNTTFFK